MSLYQLPKFETPKLKAPKFWQSRNFRFLLLVVFISSLFGFLAGLISGNYLFLEVKDYLSKLDIPIPQTKEQETETYTPQTSQENAIIKAVNEVSPAVVSIIVTKDLPVYEQYFYSPFEEFFTDPLFEFMVPQYRQKGTEKKEIGGGTGFIISEDGMVLTNKHVVLDTEADYTVLTLDGKNYSAKVLARDPVQDLAVLKIENASRTFPQVKLGDSDKLQIGQTAIAIGYVLGRYQNTVSVGVISGLGRTVTASGGGFFETLEDIIQTDAAINKGNSGGPLLNLKGEVVGINTAIDVEGQNIGFAIPINKAKRDIEQVKEIGKIVYPFLGIRYMVINEDIQEENNLFVGYGAWIISEGGEPAVVSGSAAAKAGLKEGDIILEFNNEKITTENHLAKIIMKYEPGDKVVLKVFRNEKEIILEATLDEIK
jgi:S1-C subfamily serine protease